ncbi:hypothetical protein [Paenibacillus sp. GYB003]|uniref:hypothetical protein n=1 Tax=Paenibacillus sp. GYB003 TaxID=2994392 RepID=UPI002F9690E8
MEKSKSGEQAVVVWESRPLRQAAGNGAAPDAQPAGNVVVFRPAGGAAAESEPTVVTQAMPGRGGGAKPAATVTYVGSGFWAKAGGIVSGGGAPRMAA